MYVFSTLCSSVFCRRFEAPRYPVITFFYSYYGLWEFRVSVGSFSFARQHTPRIAYVESARTCRKFMSVDYSPKPFRTSCCPGVEGQCRLEVCFTSHLSHHLCSQDIPIPYPSVLQYPLSFRSNLHTLYSTPTLSLRRGLDAACKWYDVFSHSSSFLNTWHLPAPCLF